MAFQGERQGIPVTALRRGVVLLPARSAAEDNHAANLEAGELVAAGHLDGLGGVLLRRGGVPRKISIAAEADSGVDLLLQVARLLRNIQRGPQILRAAREVAAGGEFDAALQRDFAQPFHIAR